MKQRLIPQQHCAIIFSSAAEHVHNQPNNIASATLSLLMRAEKGTATTDGYFEHLL
jgi:hypothetical protein